MAEKDEAFWQDLDHRLDQIEKDAEDDHQAIKELSRELKTLKSEFKEFSKTTDKTLRLLMEFTERVRSFAVQAVSPNGEKAATKSDQKARELLEKLKSHLSP
jgi:cell division septum initiation protein DivIVA